MILISICTGIMQPKILYYVLRGLETYSHNHGYVCVYGKQFCYVSIRKMHGAGFISGPIFTSKSSTQLNVKYNSKQHVIKNL